MSRTRPVPHPVPLGPQWTPPLLPKTPTDTGPPKPEVTRRTQRTTRQAREVTILGAEGAAPLVYGKQRLAGQILYTFGDAAQGATFWAVVGICQGEVDGLVDITINGRSTSTFTIGTINTWFYTGTSGQTVNANLAAVDPSWNEALPDICYCVVQLAGIYGYWPEFPNLLFEIRGRKCLDPRTATTAYTTNPVVQRYDYMRLPEGKNLPAGKILTSTFNSAATRADDVMSDSSKRYESHLLVADQSDPDDYLKMFDLADNSQLRFTSNQYSLLMDQPKSSTATYGDGHYVKGTESGERVEPDNRVNHVIVKYTDLYNDWKENFVEKKTAAATAGTVDLVTVTFEMQHILQSRSVADRRAVEILNRFQYDFRLQLQWTDDTKDTIVGDVITQSVGARGISAQQFIVWDRVKLPDNSFMVELLEYNAACYSSGVASGTSKINSSLPDVFADTNRTICPQLTSGAIDRSTPSTCWWEDQQLRSTEKWATWTNQGAASMSAAIMDDGLTVTRSAHFTANAQAFYVDLGSAKPIREVEIYADCNSQPGILFDSGSEMLWLEYSDNASSWTRVTAAQILYDNRLNVIDAGSFTGPWRYLTQWSSAPGSHRYWRIKANDLYNGQLDFHDVRFRYYTGIDPLIQGWQVYQGSPYESGVDQLRPVLFIDRSQRPTSTNPLNVDSLSRRSQDLTTFSGGISTVISVAAVRMNGVFSDILPLSRSSSQSASAATFEGARVKDTGTSLAVAFTTYAIAFDTEMEDSHGFWVNSAKTRFTIPAGLGGMYDLHGHLEPGNTSGTLGIWFRKNGTTDLHRLTGRLSTTGWSQNTSCSTYLVSGDYVELCALTSGTVPNNPVSGSMSIKRRGRPVLETLNHN